MVWIPDIPLMKGIVMKGVSLLGGSSQSVSSWSTAHIPPWQNVYYTGTPHISTTEQRSVHVEHVELHTSRRLDSNRSLTHQVKQFIKPLQTAKTSSNLAGMQMLDHLWGAKRQPKVPHPLGRIERTCMQHLMSFTAVW